MRSSEDGLIARHFAPIAGAGGLGLADDAARIAPRPGHEIVLTCDALVAGAHFFPDDPPASIARKALGVNVSDLAAKGADPSGFLLALALPADWTEDWLAAFAQGLGAAARDWGCPLLGGDTVRASGALTLSVTALGEVPAGRMVPRTAARPGDLLCVTGTIGDAALGLRLRGNPAWAAALPEAERAHLADRYLHPRPRMAFARALRAHARAAMDVSDGLVGDLAKMARAGGVSARIETDRVPLSPAARAALATEPALLETILTGGDDYEILFALPPDRLAAITGETGELGIGVTAIGAVTAGVAPPLVERGGEELAFAQGSFSHF